MEMEVYSYSYKYFDAVGKEKKNLQQFLTEMRTLAHILSEP